MKGCGRILNDTISSITPDSEHLENVTYKNCSNKNLHNGAFKSFARKGKSITEE